MQEDSNNSTINPEDTIKEVFNFIVGEIKQGKSKKEITEKLIEIGINRSNAIKIVETTYDEVQLAVEREKFTTESIIPSLFGGFMAAIIGGIVWGLIVKFTGYEVGYMALGIGALSGVAVLLFAKGKRGIPLQVIAVLSSIFGIIVGKYFYFYYILKEVLLDEYGLEILSIFSSEVMNFFIESIGEMADPFDILWLILAIAAAWTIPRNSGIKFKKNN